MHSLQHTWNTYIYHTSANIPRFAFSRRKSEKRKDSLEPLRDGSRPVDRAS